jgi:hypothetical protein
VAAIGRQAGSTTAIGQGFAGKHRGAGLLSESRPFVFCLLVYFNELAFRAKSAAAAAIRERKGTLGLEVLGTERGHKRSSWWPIFAE